MGPLPLKKDVFDDSPEIVPIGAKRMLQVRLQILPLAVLDLIQCLRHIRIKRRKQYWLYLDSKLLQIFIIQAVILLAQRTDTNQFHLSLNQVENHRELVKPKLAKHSTPFRDTVVVGELATHIQIIVLVDIGLQKLGIGIHRPKLIHVEHLAILADSPQLDEQTV